MTSNLDQVFPDDILMEIFTRSEPKTFARCRCLNNQWHCKLEGDKIAKRNFFMTKGKHIGILLSFGFPPWEIGRDWALNIPQGHEVNVPVTLPFTISDFGWWHVVDSDNSIVCVRYTMSGQPTQLTVWNPLTSKSRELTDPTEAGGLQAVSLYTFGYIDNSDHYIIIHISKKRFRHSILSYSVYNSGVEGWQQGEFDEGMIQNLGSNGVWNKDMAYWINWVGEDFTHLLSVIRFDAQSLKFVKLKIPKYVKKRFQYLSKYKGKLCYVGYDTVGANEKISVWNIVPHARKKKIWQHLFVIDPVGIGFTPNVFIGDEIIIISEKKSNLSKINDCRTTHISLNTVRVKGKNKKEVFSNSWMEEIELKSLTGGTRNA